MTTHSDSDETYRDRLSPEQFQVTRCGGTERAFTGKYWNNKAEGLYNCICCGAALFDSTTKYDSGSGWPSYYAPVLPDAVKSIEDKSHGMLRIEVRCAQCDGHLGHVFPDGPRPTGMRYCINSASLDFVAREKSG